ncbi:hypothetical protein BDW69DRAFT_186705 [Aspergillus filifer]
MKPTLADAAKTIEICQTDDAVTSLPPFNTMRCAVIGGLADVDLVIAPVPAAKILKTALLSIAWFSQKADVLLYSNGRTTVQVDLIPVDIVSCAGTVRAVDSAAITTPMVNNTPPVIAVTNVIAYKCFCVGMRQSEKKNKRDAIDVFKSIQLFGVAILNNDQRALAVQGREDLIKGRQLEKKDLGCQLRSSQYMKQAK